MLRRVLLSLFFATASGFAADARQRVSGVDAICVTVSDLDRSVEFYSRVLSFEKVSESEAMGEALERATGLFGVHTRTARLRLGSEFLELTEFLTPKGQAFPKHSRSNDAWFQHVAIIVSDMDRAYRWLRDHRVEHISPGPQRLPDWNPNAGGIRAFYFRDPDGHALEVLSFPEGKGKPQWHHPAQGRLFLGIDHTAIVIKDTDASLRFYGNALGMNVAGESENYGPEQERLNNVFGAHLRITAMRGSSGPGVEFLEYLAPGDGRPFPAGARMNDLVHWHTRFLGVSLDHVAHDLRKRRARFISAGVVELPVESQRTRKTILVRDPDGHAIQIVEP